MTDWTEAYQLGGFSENFNLKIDFKLASPSDYVKVRFYKSGSSGNLTIV